MPERRDSRIFATILTSFFLVAVAYGTYEAYGLVVGPSISLPYSSHVSSEQFILIEGTAERMSELRLNGARISVTETGAFKEPFLLAPGTNHFVLEARDSRGRSDTKHLTIHYMPTEAPPPPVGIPTESTSTTSESVATSTEE